MEPARIRQLIRKTLASHLEIITTVAYPDAFFDGGKRTIEGPLIFEVLVPGIQERIAGKIYEETFGRHSGSPRLQAIGIRKFMEKQYAPLREVLGEKRFEKFTNFPAKVDGWREKKYSGGEVLARLIKSVTSMYWTAARRDARIFEQDILGIMRTPLKLLPSVSAQVGSGKVSVIDIDEALRRTLQKIDVRRAPLILKELIHDLHAYAGIFYFLDKCSPESRPEKSRMGNIHVIREEIGQITGAFLKNTFFRKVFHEYLAQVILSRKVKKKEKNED